MNADIPLVVLIVIIMAVLFGFLFMRLDRAVKEQHRRGDP
jgi:preprotein translocase subunit YajC